MTRLAIVFIMACTLLGASFYVWTADRKAAEEALEARKKDLETKCTFKGMVVFAVREIQEGSVITADALEQGEIEQSKIPDAAVTLISEAVGKKANYTIGKGQILNTYELSPKPHGFQIWHPKDNSSRLRQRLQFHD